MRLRPAEPLRISRSVTTARDAVVITLRRDGLSGHGEVVGSDHLGLPTALIPRQIGEARTRIEALPGPEAAVERLGNGGELPAGLAPGVSTTLEAALLDPTGPDGRNPSGSGTR